MTAKPEDLIHDLRRKGEWFHGTARFDKSPLCQEAADLIEELLAEVEKLKDLWMQSDLVVMFARKERDEARAQNRRLQDELEKAKADLGARNRILTEEP